jgi:hypothetical protein
VLPNTIGEHAQVEPIVIGEIIQVVPQVIGELTHVVPETILSTSIELRTFNLAMYYLLWYI